MWSPVILENAEIVKGFAVSQRIETQTVNRGHAPESLKYMAVVKAHTNFEVQLWPGFPPCTSKGGYFRKHLMHSNHTRNEPHSSCSFKRGKCSRGSSSTTVFIHESYAVSLLPCMCRLYYCPKVVPSVD